MYTPNPGVFLALLARVERERVLTYPRPLALALDGALHANTPRPFRDGALALRQSFHPTGNVFTKSYPTSRATTLRAAYAARTGSTPS
jgi:hypothetical protein